MVTAAIDPRVWIPSVAFLNLRDFGFTSDLAIKNGETERLGTFNVDDQTLQAWGNGEIARYNENTTRTFKIALNTAANTVASNLNVRLSVANKSESYKRQYVRLQSNALAETNGVPNLEVDDVAGQPNDKLIIEVENVSGADVTLDASECSATIPTTRFEQRV